MTVTVVRYQTKADRADENQQLVEAVYEELAASQPDGFRYLTVRLGDGVSFVHVATHDDGSPNPLATTAAFAEFQREIADRCDGRAGRRAGSLGRFLRLRPPRPRAPPGLTEPRTA